MLADPVGERLIHVSTDGTILNTVDLKQLEIRYIFDMSVKGDVIYLLASVKGSGKIPRASIGAGWRTHHERGNPI